MRSAHQQRRCHEPPRSSGWQWNASRFMNVDELPAELLNLFVAPSTRILSSGPEPAPSNGTRNSVLMPRSFVLIADRCVRSESISHEDEGWHTCDCESARTASHPASVWSFVCVRVRVCVRERETKNESETESAAVPGTGSGPLEETCRSYLGQENLQHTRPIHLLVREEADEKRGT